MTPEERAIKHADFLLRADENSEMFVDVSMDVIRAARTMDHPTDPHLPDPIIISHRNIRLLLRAAFKAGACFGFEEIIALSKERLP